MSELDNVTLHPALAREIARHVINRSLASDTLGSMFARKGFKPEDFLFWRNEHIAASASLRKLGIPVGSYDTDSWKGATK